MLKAKNVNGSLPGFPHWCTRPNRFIDQDTRSLCLCLSVDRPDLVHFIERQSLDPHHQLDQWVHSFLRKGGSTNTRALLVNLTRTIKQTFTYVARHEKGIQPPLLNSQAWKRELSR